MRRRNRRVVITGGSSGISQETARLLLAEGARVALLDLNGGEAEASSLGQGAFGITCDVADQASVQMAVEAAEHALGGVDGPVNSTGVSLWRPLAGTSHED